ncbi:MAG: xanthine dehydrogenase family protein molybdopterin-binding subunit [Spirochaetota bacterium]
MKKESQIRTEVGYKYIGQSIPRVDAVEKVTGEAEFIADLYFPDVLHIKLVRSKVPHARIKKIYLDDALRVEGVRGIITGEKAGFLVGICIHDQPPIAREKVRFVGEPVAAVVAENLKAAKKACDLVRVEYGELKAVFDPLEALREDAPRLHEGLGHYFHLPSFNPVPGSNIFHHYHLEKGNVEAGFKRSSFVLERSYSFPHISHAQLEPHGAIARWSSGGELHIYTSSQAPHIVSELLSRIFSIPQSKIRVSVPFVGGGFGGKSDFTLEPLVSYVARFFPGKWVRLILDREEMFFGSLIGRGCRSVMKMGASRDGKILAAEVKMYFGGGAYGDCVINIVTGGGHNSTGPYEIENVVVDSYGVYTNNPPVGAYRGYGHPEAHWMTERHIEVMAEALGISSLEFRLKNILRPGSENNLGQIIREENGDLESCVRIAAREIGFEEDVSGYTEKKKVFGVPSVKIAKDVSALEILPQKRFVAGRGIAALMKSPVISTSAGSSAIIRANADGSFELQVSAIDIGQGSMTVLTQIAAETLDVPVDKIRLFKGADTSLTPYEWQTVASSTTWKAGNAVRRAALQIIDSFKEIASVVLDVPKEGLSIRDGCVWYGNESIPYSRLALGYVFPDGKTIHGPVIGWGSVVPEGMTYPDPKTGRGELAAEWTFGCQAAEVEVDVYTGRIRVKKFVTVIDAGKIINPVLAKGQVEGAVVQGMGATLNEVLIYSKEGIIRNASLTDYKIPTAQDIPEKLVTIFLENPQPDSPYGVRPIAEHGIVSVAPAIANAVKDATGVDFYDLPLNPDRVIEALYGKKV